MVIKFAAQLFFVVAISVGGYLAFGHVTYGMIGSVIAVVVLALLMTRSQWGDDRVPPDADESELPTVALEFFYRLMLSLLLGVFWPSLPFIVGYGRTKDASSKMDDQDPPLPS